MSAIATPHYAASAVGAHVLEDGGSAVDAAIAANAMLGVVYPHMCGLGGDCFLLYFEARTGEVHCINGTGPAPLSATPEAFAARGLDSVPVRGVLPVTVPGTIAAWEAAHARFGSRPLAELLAPAAGAAREGIPLTARVAAWIADNAADLQTDPTLARRFLDAAGQPLGAGATLVLPELADTIDRLIANGPADFYRGELAREIGAACADAGGFLGYEDLQAYAPSWVRPLQATYAGLDVFVPPPNSQGIAALLMLKHLSERDGGSFLAPGTAEHIRALVRAKRLALARRDELVTDPDDMTVSAEEILAEDWAATSDAAFSQPLGGDTVYLCALDDAGNAVSLIQSIYYGFGSCFVPGDTGVLMQNRGHYFSLDPAHPNVLRPGKRTLHTLMASMALANGELRFVFGSMGADGQPQANVQVLERYRAGADAATAVTAPRVLHGRFVLEDDPDILHIEADMGDDVIDELSDGVVHVVPARSERMGHAHAIAIGDDGSVTAGADPRSDGTAIVLN